MFFRQFKFTDSSFKRGSAGRSGSQKKKNPQLETRYYSTTHVHVARARKLPVKRSIDMDG